MSEKKEEGSWLFWIIAFLVIAFFVYIWLVRDEEGEKDAEERAVGSLRDVESKIDEMRHKAQSVIQATEERIAKASANLAKDLEETARKAKEEAPAVAESVKKSVEEATEAIAEEVEGVVEALDGDDLTRIEGIGPKYRDALVSAGISTFADIADKSEGELTAIVREAGMRRPASIATWAEQARLASQSDWDALEALQDKLKGGRR